MFLREIEKRQFQRLKIRQWMLLALRTLAVLLLVAGFARPALEGTTAGMVGRASSEAVVLLDDTPSMGYSDARGARMNWANSKLTEIASLMRPQDQALLVRLSQPDLVSQLLPLPQTALAVSPKSGDVQTALSTAAYVLSQASKTNRELYIVSDLAGESWAGLEATQWPERTTAFVIAPAGRGAEQNAAVESLEVAGELARLGRDLTVEATIANTGPDELEDLGVSLWVGGRRVQQTAIAVPSNRRRRVTFKTPLNKSGWVDIEVRCSDDALRKDNSRRVVLRVPEHTSILVLGDDLWQLSVVTAALGAAGDNQLEITIAAPTSVGSEQVEMADVIVLVDVPRLDQRRSGWIKRALTQNAGLLVLMGPSVDLQTYNRDVLPWITSGRATGIKASDRTRSVSSQDTVGYYSLVPEADGPVLEGITKALAHSGPKTTSYVIVKASQSAAQLRFGTADPALIFDSGTAGRGAIITSGIAPGWTDLALTGLFVPLIHRALAAVSGSIHDQVSFVPGDSSTIPLPNEVVGALSLESPSGMRRSVSTTATRRGRTAELGELGELGVWKLFAAKRQAMALAVNLTPLESWMTPNTAKKVTTVAGLKRVVVIDGQVDMAVEAARFGSELAWLFLAGALVCLATEVWLQRSRRALGNDVAKKSPTQALSVAEIA